MPPRRPRARTRSVQAWVADARDAILELVSEEHAVVWNEVEARIADRPWRGREHYIEPHHLSSARRLLMAADVLAETDAMPTRGGRPISVLHLKDLHRRKTNFETAAMRKRLLQARYLSWAYGDKSTTALLGPSGERVVRASLLAAPGFRPEGAGEVSRLMGAPVIGGALDAAGYLPAIDENGIPVTTIVVPVEVKNRRDWLYPSTSQVYQLLYKAAELQQAHPNHLFVPVLVSRRQHISLTWMAFDLGFFAIETKAQFIDWPSPEDPRLLEEVREELGYEDLVVHTGSWDRIVDRVSISLPKVAVRSAERWAHYGPILLPHFKVLRREIAEPERSGIVNELRMAASNAGAELGW